MDLDLKRNIKNTLNGLGKIGLSNLSEKLKEDAIKLQSSLESLLNDIELNNKK